jgi:hypothetical protein
MNKTIEPAFPVISGSWHRPGISIRDYFAAKAMQAMIQRNTGSAECWPESAYEMADAMLKAREK